MLNTEWCSLANWGKQIQMQPNYLLQKAYEYKLICYTTLWNMQEPRVNFIWNSIKHLCVCGNKQMKHVQTQIYGETHWFQMHNNLSVKMASLICFWRKGRLFLEQ